MENIPIYFYLDEFILLYFTIVGTAIAVSTLQRKVSPLSNRSVVYKVVFYLFAVTTQGVRSVIKYGPHDAGRRQTLGRYMPDRRMQTFQTHTEKQSDSEIFRFLLNQLKSDCIYHFQLDIEPNALLLGSKSIVNGKYNLIRVAATITMRVFACADRAPFGYVTSAESCQRTEARPIPECLH